MSFVHLHVHTEYSLSDGIVRIPELAATAAEMALPALAVTELANMYSAVKCYRALRAQGVKPLLGAELYCYPPDADGRRALPRIILLCQHYDAYINLSRIITRSFTEGQCHGVATVRPEWFAGGQADGLIVIHPMSHGALSLQQPVTRSEQDIHFWQQHFPDRCYLEICRLGKEGEEDQLAAILAFASQHAVPVVASNDVRFLRQEDYEAHEARVCINQSCILGDPGNRSRYHYTRQQYLRNGQDMRDLFADFPEAIENTLQLAMRCNVELTLGQFFLPHFPLPEGESEGDLLCEKARHGLAERLSSLPVQPQAKDSGKHEACYQERLAQELAIIQDMGYSGYFLIVQDFVCWSKSKRIPVGPGRGSGAGSLVAWALGIVEIDPLRFDLLFERFLNPERVSLPDFDIDFCMSRRDEVIDYVVRKYGNDRVARIITYGTMAAKAAVRDVGRVLGHPYGFVDRIARLVPFRLGITLQQALNDEEELARCYQEDEETRNLIDLAMKLEGIVRNVSTHAGGLVVAPKPLTEYMPLYCEAGSELLATQFDMGDVEAIGLVKFDFLGLRTLTIMDWSMRDVNALRAAEKQAPINIDSVPLDDRDTYDLIKAANTTAVFQLESDRLRSYMKQLKPDTFDNLFAMVALYRPGPIGAGMVDDFIARRHGAPIQYLHDSLRPILEQTMGVIIYQEQVMQIAQVLAGYSLGSADLLRRAMGKKKPGEMAEQRQIFIQGAQKNGIQLGVAQKVFDQMQHFAGYGFNKSHSVAYALLAYQTAWLKTHYPAQFMAAVMSADMDNTDKLDMFLGEVRKLSVTIYPPSINHSEIRFVVSGGHAIRYGLGAIKGVGSGAIQNMIRARDGDGPFADLFDLCRRVDLQRTNRRVLESLIKSGAMDEFGVSRARLIQDIDAAISVAEQHGRNQILGQHDMFGIGPLAMPREHLSAAGDAALIEWQPGDRLRKEKEALGLYFSSHPTQLYGQEIRQIISHDLEQVAQQIGAVVTVAGCVRSCRAIGRRGQSRGSRRFDLQLGDHQANLAVIVPEALVQEEGREYLTVDQILIVTGKVERDRFNIQGYSLRATELYNLPSYREQQGALVLSLSSARVDDALPIQLRGVLDPYRGGRAPVQVCYQKNGTYGRIRLGSDWYLRLEENLLYSLAEILGQENVCVVYEQDKPRGTTTNVPSPRVTDPAVAGVGIHPS